ncbi:MAG: FecR domain-containing protein [Acidobacteriia bacterium]|nr:FecR domain-containing protein [Terriglobia bacterium]
MKSGRVLAILAILMFAVTGWMTSAVAQESGQDAGPSAEQSYPAGPNGEAAPRSEGPAPDVARISLISGDVSTQRGDTGDWAVTSINAPLVRGDQVATGEKSRTEIQLDYADLLRLAARSQVKIADLTRTRIQIQVAQGYASYTMLKGGEAEVEIDTPNVAVHPLKHGRYRVQVNSDSETDVIVREGEAEITTPQGSTRVREGEMIAIRGTDQPEYKISSAPGKDDWDRWNKDRDHVINEAEGSRRTNRYYTGAGDLDGYGRWVYVPGYGNVWQPYQQATWAPYQTGRWVWEPYYGWTWVSYEPWGWAPYHYGRWFYYGNYWCWWPGPVHVSYRPLWSPAFVFFVGFGHHHSGFGFGSIGWFPVGPHDAFYPWYGRGFNRVNVVNVTNINVINVNNRYVVPPLGRRGHQPYYSNADLVLKNPRVRGSITSVATEDFGRGGGNRRHGMEEHEWREARVMTAQVPVVPTRESLHSGSGNGGIPAGIQTRNTDRFYTRHQPPAGPESFHDQAARVQRVVGPEAAGAQGGTRGDFHAGPGQVDRHDIGGNGGINVRTGNAEVPRVGGSPNGGITVTQNPGQQGRVGNEGSGERDSFRRFPGNNNGQNTPAVGGMPGPKDSPGHMAPGANEGIAQNNAPPANNNNAGNAASDNRRDNRDRGGWSKFGPPLTRSNTGPGEAAGQNGTPNSRSNDVGHVPRTDSTPAQTPRTQEDRGWQRFPQNQNNDRGPKPSDLPANRNDRIDPSGSSGSKPPLELHRPIVTPRQPDVRPNVRNEQHSTPLPSQTPEVHSEPRYTPPQRSEPRYSPPQRSEPRYSPPPQRSEPRYSPPPQRSEPRYSPPSQRSESHSGSGSSSHSGGSDRGSHSDSKSSSNPKR